MRKIFIFLLMLVFAGTTFAQAPAKKLSKRDKAIREIKYKVEDDQVIEILQKYNSDIRWSIKEKKPLTALQYASFASLVNMWIKYRWFIADTGLSKKWLKKVHELLTYMSKTQGYIESAKFSGNTESAKYQKALEYFNLAYSRFAKLISKPVKVSGKYRRNAQKKRIVWEKALRKKFKIKQKF